VQTQQLLTRLLRFRLCRARVARAALARTNRDSHQRDLVMVIGAANYS
jgi:hypothetical protein